MNSTVAPAPWSRAAGSAPVAWRFGRMAAGDDAPRVEWLLKRNCSISPKQLFAVYLSLCVVSLAIALSFSWAGASPVLAFAGVELLLVGMALLIYGRHAADHEYITLSGGALAVEHHHGPRLVRSEFRAARVRVEPLSSDRSLIELADDGQTARIGRYMRPELRQSLAQELRAALRASHGPAVREPHEEPAIKRSR